MNLQMISNRYVVDLVSGHCPHVDHGQAEVAVDVYFVDGSQVSDPVLVVQPGRFADRHLEFLVGA